MKSLKSLLITTSCLLASQLFAVPVPQAANVEVVSVDIEGPSTLRQNVDNDNGDTDGLNYKEVLYGLPDNNNYKWDREDAPFVDNDGNAMADDELEAASVSIIADSDFNGTVVVTLSEANQLGSPQVNALANIVWEDQEKSASFTFPLNYTVTNGVLVRQPGGPPINFFLEGHYLNAPNSPTTLTATLTGSGDQGNGDATDTLEVTVEPINCDSFGDMQLMTAAGFPARPAKGTADHTYLVCTDNGKNVPFHVKVNWPDAIANVHPRDPRVFFLASPSMADKASKNPQGEQLREGLDTSDNPANPFEIFFEGVSEVKLDKLVAVGEAGVESSEPTEAFIHCYPTYTLKPYSCSSCQGTPTCPVEVEVNYDEGEERVEVTFPTGSSANGESPAPRITHNSMASSNPGRKGLSNDISGTSGFTPSYSGIPQTTYSSAKSGNIRIDFADTPSSGAGAQDANAFTASYYCNLNNDGSGGDKFRTIKLEKIITGTQNHPLFGVRNTYKQVITDTHIRNGVTIASRSIEIEDGKITRGISSSNPDGLETEDTQMISRQFVTNQINGQNVTTVDNYVIRKVISHVAVGVDGNGQPTVTEQPYSVVENTYKNTYGSFRLIESVNDPDGAALSSTWTYGVSSYQIPASIAGTPIFVAYPNATVAEVYTRNYNRYDGYFEYNTYQAGIRNIKVTPFGTDSDPATSVHGRVEKTVWTSDLVHDIETYLVGDVANYTTAPSLGTISKTQITYTPTTTTVKRYSNATDFLATTTERYAPGHAYEGETKEITYPDGTSCTFSYSGGVTELNPLLSKTTTKIDRIPDGSGGHTNITQRVTTMDAAGYLVSTKTTDIPTGAVLDERVVLSVDAALCRPNLIGYFPTGSNPVAYAYKTSKDYSCCDLSSETDRYGVTTYYYYDDLIRRIKTNRLGVSTETKYEGLTTTTYRYAQTVQTATLLGDASNRVSKTVRNLSGTQTTSYSPDPTSTVDGDLVPTTSTTTYAQASNVSRTVIVTVPKVAGEQAEPTQTTKYFQDGRTAETFGDLSPSMVYSYGVNGTGMQSTQSYLDGATLRETTTTTSDWLGRSVKVDYADGAFSESFYNSLGQLERSVDPDGVTVIYDYNERQDQTITTVDLDRDGNVDYGVDTVYSSESLPFVDGNGKSFIRTISKVWQDGQTTEAMGTTASTSFRATDGLSSSTTTISATDPTMTVATPSESVTTLSGGGDWEMKVTNPDETYTITSYVDGLQDSTEFYDKTGVQVSAVSIRDSSMDVGSGYDGLNRIVSRWDSRKGDSTMAYQSATSDYMASVTDEGSRTTNFTYDKRGRRTLVNAPDTAIAGGTSNNETQTLYFADGTVQEVTGSQTYRRTYTYDFAQRMKTMTTYGGQQATTIWSYSSDRGFLTRKQYDDNKGTDYEYTSAGRLEKRTWARGTVTDYGYDNNGQMTTITYSDTTPNVSMTYDSLGRLKTQSNGVAKSVFSYTNTLLLDDETITYDFDTDGTPEFVRKLDRHHDDLRRPDGWEFKTGLTVNHANSYGYGDDGRLQHVDPSYPLPATPDFEYEYLPNSYQLIEKVIGPAHTVKNVWEGDRNVLVTKTNHTGTLTQPISEYDYLVSGTTPADGANAIGQRVKLSTAGSAFDANLSSTSASGPAFDWAYNLRGEVVEANDTSARAEDRAYQYDGIGNRQKTVDGLLVNLPTTENYLANSLNQYTKADGVTLPAPAYDADGNYTNGPIPVATGNATLEWDAENRLIKITRADTTVITYRYDALGRRISKKVGGNSEGSYFYDGWNLIVEYAGMSLKMGYTWGMDLSGSMQGAGGVGGLLAVTDQAASGDPTYYPTYDGNGNVSEYLDSSGVIQAHYEYDAFGNTTLSSGAKKDDFFHRFSTKPLDEESGLYYYGYRYYDPVTGRWPSRDPMGENWETGEFNEYAFISNDGINWWDILGLQKGRVGWTKPSSHSGWSNGWKPRKPVGKRGARGRRKARITGEYSDSGEADGSAKIIAALISRLSASGDISDTIILAYIPGGSIEFDISLSGTVCPCKASDGSVGLQFEGTAAGQIRGGIGFVLGHKNKVAGTQQGGKYLTVKDRVTGKDVAKSQSGKSGLIQASSASTPCETSGSLQFNIGAIGVGGIGFWGGVIDLPFGTMGTEKTEWDFSPKVTASFGLGQPVGLRIDLKGGTSAKGKWATKK